MAFQQGDLEKQMRQLHDAADSGNRGVSSDWGAWIECESLPKYGVRLSRALRNRLSDLALAAMAAFLCSSTPPLHDAPHPQTVIDSPAPAPQQQIAASTPPAHVVKQTVPEPQIAPPARAPVQPVRPTSRPAPVSQRRTVMSDTLDIPGLDETIIRNYIVMSYPRIRYCYEQRLLGHPQLAGTVEARFVIDASGAVTKSTARGLDQDVARCVAGAISTIAFPEPGGRITRVTYPFQFVPVRR